MSPAVIMPSKLPNVAVVVVNTVLRSAKSIGEIMFRQARKKATTAVPNRITIESVLE
jgi:hypothetical protein